MKLKSFRQPKTISRKATFGIGLGHRMPRAVSELPFEPRLTRWQHNPQLGIKIDETYRFYRIKKSYPFYLVYRTEPAKLVIVAIAHNRREPGYWRVQ